MGAGAAATAVWLMVAAWPPTASARSVASARPNISTHADTHFTPGDLAGIVTEAQRVQKADVEAWKRYRFRRQTLREWFDEDGALTEKEDLLFVVTPTTGGFDEELVGMNGAAPPPDDVETHRREAMFTRHYNEMMQSESGDIGNSGYTLATLLKMSAYDYAGMEVIHGVLCHRLDFRPDDSLAWGGIAGKIARAMSGSLWITADGHHVAAAHTRTVRPVTLYLSLSKVKDLEITMESQPVADDVWLPGRIEVVSKVRVLFNVLRKRNTIHYTVFEPAQAVVPDPQRMREQASK